MESNRTSSYTPPVEQLLTYGEGRVYSVWRPMMN